MTVDELDLEQQLRTTLRAWASEAPPVIAEWGVSSLPARRRATRSWAHRAVPLAAVAAVIAAVVLVQARPTPDPTVVTGRRDLVTAEVRVGESLGVRVLAVGDGALYVASENDRRLYRVDDTSYAVSSGPSLAVPDAVRVVDGAVLAVIDDPVRLARLDPESLAVTEAVALTGEPSALTVVDDRVWVLDVDEPVRLFDVRTLAKEGMLPEPLGPGFQDQGGAGLWRTDLDAGTVLRLDPSSGETLATVAVDGEARSIVVDDDAVWVGDVANGRVLRLDPETGDVEAAIGVGRFPHGLALGEDRLWVTNFEDGTLTTIDTDRDVVLTTVPIGVRPGSIVLDDGRLWVSIHQEGLVRAVDPNELETESIRPIAEREQNVDIGGRSLFLRCMGEGDPGAPTVVLEAGAGQWSEHELFVQYGLQSTHRVCAYDRAGLGRSDPGPEPRTAQRIADDLSRALEEADVPGPYVLVGHGHGGLFARLFAAQHPDDVQALVLVGSVTPTFMDELRPLLDAEQRAGLDAGLVDPEFAGLAESGAQVAAARSLGDLPLVVVTGDQTLRDIGDAAADLWQRHQRSLLDLSTDSRLVVAEGASASLAAEVPDVVVDAVRSVAGS